MDEYLADYDSYTKQIVYNFKLGNGGIGDFCKFFMCLLCVCVTNKYKIRYLINNIGIEKHILLKNSQFYINYNELPDNFIIADTIEQIYESDCILITPHVLYHVYNYNELFIQAQDVFKFSNIIQNNYYRLFTQDIDNYVSIHMRLGDKYLETDISFVVCKEDERQFDERSTFKFIEDNSHLNIVFFCDNNQYKQLIKSRYPNLIITNCNIGHTSLYNTTEQQLIDTVTEFYILCNSTHIYSASSFSGFSIMASKFKNIPLTNLCGISQG
jgi:hypothetical protein